MAKRIPPSQRAERQLDPAAQESARLAEEAKAEAKKALKAERRAADIARPTTHGAGSAGLSGTKSAGAGSQPQIRRSKSGGGG